MNSSVHRVPQRLTGLSGMLLVLLLASACGGTRHGAVTGEPTPTPTAAVSAATRVGALVIRDVFTPAPASPDTAAVYFTVQNTGDGDDALLAAATDIADEVQLHRTVMEGGAMKMQPVPRIAVPAHGEARLARGGLHVMLLGLRRPLREGDRFELRLTFERAGAVTVVVPVRSQAEITEGATPVPSMGH
jgi:copper(I)-binding protein